MNKNEAYKQLVEISKSVGEVEDYILSMETKLNIVLLNLKIQSSHLKDARSIQPIANELERCIHEIGHKVRDLVDDTRDKIPVVLEVLKPK